MTPFWATELATLKVYSEGGNAFKSLEDDMRTVIVAKPPLARYICMESLGYKYKGTYNPRKVCSLEKYKTLPACQPDAEIPTPSVERRLNSWYCKVKSDYEYCLEHALAPRLCSREKVVNPPPECLPPGQEYKSSSAENQPERKMGTQAYEPISEYPEKSLQLQQEIQRDSNRQMDKLLRDTVLKTHR